MTEVQNFMLVVCFGCTIGFLIGTFSIMVSDGIHYLKKRLKKFREMTTIKLISFVKERSLKNRRKNMRKTKKRRRGSVLQES